MNGFVFNTDAAKRDRLKGLGGWDSRIIPAMVALTMWDLVAVFRGLDSMVVVVLGSDLLTRRT